MAIIAGKFGTVELVSHVSVAYMSSISYLFFMGTSFTCTSLIGNAVGEKKPIKAKNYATATLYSTSVLWIFVMLFFRIFRYQWVEFWTDDQQTIEYMLSLIFIYQLSVQPNDAITNAYYAILKAVGKQSLAGWGVVFCYYGFSLPLTLLFVFSFGMGVLGLWIAFGISNCLLTFFFTSYICRIDWDQVVKHIDREMKRAFTTQEVCRQKVRAIELNEVLIKSNHERASSQ